VGMGNFIQEDRGMKDERLNDLEERVKQFEILSLPGQPKMMHMGTSYLVGDLWRMVKELSGEYSPKEGA
jgi:hypothetical protein